MSNSIEKTIYSELSKETLEYILNNEKDKIVIIKMGAEWCRPCLNIKSDVYSYFNQMPDNVLCFDLDIDQNFEIFNEFKKKKMVKSIPVLMVYYCKKPRDHWYIADNNISNSDKNVVFNFFKEIINNV